MALSFTTPSYSPARTHWQNSFYYLDISDAPVHPNSTAALATTKAYHQGFGRNWIQFNPYTTANWNTTIFEFFGFYPAPSGNYSEYQASYFVDTYPYPTAYSTSTWNLSAGGGTSNGTVHGWFPDLRAENARGDGVGGFYLNYLNGDRHTIMWAEENNQLVESTGYTKVSNNPYAENVVTYDLNSYTLPVNGATMCGVVAARIPFSPFLFNYNDLVACGSTGDLGHMVGWIARDYSNTHQWPARDTDGLQTNGGLWAGSVIRLRPDFPLNSLPNDPMRAFARTLQKYGALLYDKNFNNAVFGVPSDSNWPTGFGSGVQSFTYDDFQVVDMSGFQVAANSIEVNTGTSYSTGALDQLAARLTALESLQ